MTKAQALNLVNALEARKIPCMAILRFDSAGVATWSVQLDAGRTYSGDEISTLANYCATNNLSLTATFDQLGVI